jgi:hypothetical protein
MNETELKLSVEVETKGGVRRPVHWTCRQSLNQDGSFPLHLEKADAPGWLKGV